MSLRYEQHRALRLSRDLLAGICNGTVKRIPKAVRTQARLALRHFPPLTDENEPIFSRDKYVAFRAFARDRCAAGGVDGVSD